MHVPPQFYTPVCLVFFGNAAALYGEKGPVPATPYSIGVDLRASLPDDKPLVIPAGERYAVGTGLGIEPQQPGIAGFVYSRSGLGAKTGLTVAQGVGLIDPDYRGEITVYMLNTSKEPQTISRGDRIAQLVMQSYFLPEFQIVDSLSQSLRGAGGFGHTGNV